MNCKKKDISILCVYNNMLKTNKFMCFAAQSGSSTSGSKPFGITRPETTTHPNPSVT